ncbi:hypothetical protein JQ557_26170 [Bradyrhizobium sp. U87765 SZCCT0131]|uniref:hypothetical protein n=1 Tax=unclassified Bradyrhizobium TaxID=2631580 RepID=UPI001BA86A71|nr:MULTISPECIES: hypothetical protein [unclassified Bradyrhizobium]MBR1221512.1 hypothetical protein [Bradyrhizobium sp. U87765 SZCCT0131]MBR1264565.1 hypothetical protein [Bradyrhizobium sp. U87765 SZCCT0134]MBR1304529.1 hypothetical protein [Bradyrhizobium sp. U87765 SZCCT0110]MBR1322614.1 hypothetical protein [Bradyrhizobium sp. U87765 SZCCT0109]MBR1346458.1 hypothetical protein [Bradyrhizobium sp. U87765 SZCCT0048]
MPDTPVVFASIILLLPMLYLFLAAPAFLLVRLDILPVARLLRAMFNGYFVALTGAGVIGTVAVAVTGHLSLALGIGVIAAVSALSRGWFLRQVDERINGRETENADAARRLRHLHLGGMLVNAIQLVVVVASIPHFATASS